MITEIEIEGFKSLKHVKLTLGHLNLFVGTNASGKSNFLEALRVLQGIGLGFTIGEIFDGKPKSDTNVEWAPIRGGSQHALFESWQNRKKKTAESIRFSIGMKIDPDEDEVGFSIVVDPIQGIVISERFQSGKTLVYESEKGGSLTDASTINVRYFPGDQITPIELEFDNTKPVLQQLANYKQFRAEQAWAVWTCANELGNAQRIDPLPSVLRQYSQTINVKRLGEEGENFAALVSQIIRDKKKKEAYLSWLKELTPSEVDDVVVLEGALREPLFALRHGGVNVPAPILSNGTLRFAAIAAALFQPSMPALLTIEEIENGIHASRLRVLVNLLKSQAHFMQVMATTHSTVVLEWLKESDYQTTFFCKRHEKAGESMITPLADVPRFIELARKYPVTELMTEGWLEDAV